MSTLFSIQQDSPPPVVENKNSYLKAIPLRDFSDVDKIVSEVSDGNILVIRISPIARRSVEDTKQAVTRLHREVRDKGGDIARLGTDRIVVTPVGIRIWRG